MNNTTRFLSRIALGLLLVVGSTTAAVAQDSSKPVAVVSIAAVDELLADIGYLTQASGSPEYGALVSIMAGQFTLGVDTSKPAGAFVTMDGEPSAVIFVPVSDFDAIALKLEESVGELEDVGGGVSKLSAQRAVYIKEIDGWAFASDKLEHLKNLPEDPVQLLDGLNDTYDIAIRVNVQNIPEEVRKTAISEIKEGFQRGIQNQLDEEQRQIQEQFGERALGDIERLAAETEQITLGWSIDKEGARTFLDLGMTALAGTSLAKQFGAYAETTSNYAGFLLPDAAATFHFTAPLAKEDIEQTLTMVKVMREKALQEIDEDDDLPDDATRAEAKDIVGSLIDVLQETVEAGNLNGGGSLLLAPGEINFVAGGFIADGTQIEKDLKRVVELAKKTEETPENVEVKFNVSEHAGVSFHTLTVGVPEDEEEARKILGEKMVVTVGTAAKSVYVGFGDKSTDLLKQVIDKSAAAVADTTLPMEFHVALGPILAFAASIEADPIVKGLAEAIQNSEGNDTISITATAVERGATYRIEIEEGVLQLIGQAAKLQNRRDRDPF